MVRAKVSLHATFRLAASGTRKHHFSKQHLAAAKLFAAEAREIEITAPSPYEKVRVRHRAYVTASILSAVAFLEASINELYLSATGKEKLALPSFDSNTFELFAQFWQKVERYPVLEKYQIALLLAHKHRFDCGKPPFQNADCLVELRNTLIHYEPDWEDKGRRHGKLVSHLKGKFRMNPFAAKGALWFPHQCLGAGCAAWSVETASTFSDQFCDCLGIPKRTT
jgi:hypothetical protein